MSLDYSCDEPKTPEQLQQQIMDLLGVSYQTAGYIASLIGNSVMNAITPAAITTASVQSSINDVIVTALRQSQTTLNNSRSTVAVANSSVAGQTLSAASRCIRDCESCCGTIKNGIWQPLQSSTPVSDQKFDPNAPVPSFNYPPSNSLTTQSSNLPYPDISSKPIATITTTPDVKTINVYPPACPVPSTTICPTQKIVVVQQNPLPDLNLGGYDKYCNDLGEGVILESKFQILNDPAWKKVAHSQDQNGPWPDCSGAVSQSQPTIFNSSPGLNSPDSFIIPSSCDIDFYSGAVHGNFADFSAKASGDIAKAFGSIGESSASERLLFAMTATASLINSSYGCGSNEVAGLQQLRGYYQFFEKVTGISSDQIDRRISYDINRLCPSIMPTAEQALQNYLSNAIQTEQELKKYVEINGHCWEPFRQKIQSERSKYIPAEIFALTRRGRIQPQYTSEHLRQLGYLHPEQWADLEALQEFIPGPQDIVRFMVRDTVDPNTVDRFHLDDQFTDKFQSDLSKWAKWQGIPENTMRQFWRSHWRVPGVGQLFEMFQRNRRKPYGDKSKLEIADVRAALGQDDYLPFWQDRLETLLYRPISQRYIYEVYHYGGVNEDELFEHLCYVGYSDESARAVANGFEIKKRDGIYQSQVVHHYLQQLIDRSECKSELVKFGYRDETIESSLDILDLHFHNHRDIGLYKNGTISYQECTNRLTLFGIRRQSVDILLEGVIPNLQFSVALKRLKGLELDRESAQAELQQEGVESKVATKIVNSVAADLERDLAVKCRDNIKHEYLIGAYNRDEARNKLIGFDIALEWANQLLSSWDCEKSSQGKAIPTNTLCDWFSKGVIGPGEFSVRLVNIGYSVKDAGFIVSDCVDKNNNRIRKQQETALKKLQADIAKKQAEADKAARKNEAASEKAAKAREAARKADDKRKSALMGAAAKYAVNSGIDPIASSQVVLDLFNSIKNDYGVSTDIAIESIQKAVIDITPDNATAIADIATAFLTASQDAIDLPGEIDTLA